MKIIGIDIGTTTLSAIVMVDNTVIDSFTDINSGDMDGFL